MKIYVKKYFHISSFCSGF